MDFLYFLGRFHVLALHLPIGIIVALFVLEWLARREKYRYLEAASPFLWGAMALSALLTVVLGYLHFSEGSFVGSSATQHRNFGTAVALIATAVAFLRTSSFADNYKAVYFPASVLLLFLISITGHFGGNLTHGSSYLVEYAPQPLRSLAGLAPRRRVTSVAEADAFEDVVAPMLSERCTGCHNSDKKESGLDLSSYETAMRGGENGKVIAAGNTEQSELLRRISLPHDDEEFMPAEGKTPLTPQQVEIVRWWIGAGAPRGTAIGTLEVPAGTQALIASELGLNF
jgi:uncharacterized membrane protein